MARHTRYQGAIVQDDHILLIQHQQHSTGRAYWVLPGGGLDGSESEEACVVREMKEETNLEVAVERLLLDEPGHPDGMYKWRKTYLCRPLSGDPRPGYEPELEAAADYAIAAVRWFDLREESSWGADVREDRFTYPQLVRIREALGYTS